MDNNISVPKQEANVTTEHLVEASFPLINIPDMNTPKPSKQEGKMPKRKYALIMGYNGTKFYGSQIQYNFT